nr:hypothetical protein [Variovorax boronicumulans]
MAAPHAGPQGSWLQLHSFDAAAPAREQPHDLLAERLLDAASLPWLQGGRTLDVNGRWLVARGMGRQPVACAPNAMDYAALPVGVAVPGV